MNAPTDLPGDVINAIQAGRQIEAIKLLRAAKGIGLKEAKEAVDAYGRANPSLQPHQANNNRLVLVVFVLLLGYLGYKLLA